jgi:hypothetical protein
VPPTATATRTPTPTYALVISFGGTPDNADTVTVLANGLSAGAACTPNSAPCTYNIPALRTVQITASQVSPLTKPFSNWTNLSGVASGCAGRNPCTFVSGVGAAKATY